MREIRIFELEHGEPAETWRLAQALQLHVSEGELWLTIGGDAHDYWLRAGESMTLAAGARVWLSAGGDGARFVLALGGASAEIHRQAVGFAGWIAQALPRLRQRAALNTPAVSRAAG
jgi:quercetin dioxygenase-like cupin family protein